MHSRKKNKFSHDLKVSKFGGFWWITLLIPNQLKKENTFLLSTIKILLSIIFKFGRTAQIFTKLTLFHHTLNGAHEVLWRPLVSLRLLFQRSTDKSTKQINLRNTYFNDTYVETIKIVFIKQQSNGRSKKYSSDCPKIGQNQLSKSGTIQLTHTQQNFHHKKKYPH